MFRRILARIEGLFNRSNVVQPPRVVGMKKNTGGRKDTALPMGSLPTGGNTSDGIWYEDMTEEDKKRYGIHKASEKK